MNISNFFSNFIPSNGNNFINHDLRGLLEPIVRGRLNRQAEQFSILKVACDGAYDDAGMGVVDQVGLYDHRWPGFPIITGNGDQDDLAAFHSHSS